MSFAYCDVLDNSGASAPLTALNRGIHIDKLTITFLKDARRRYKAQIIPENMRSYMSGKVFQAVFILVFAAMIIAPLALAETENPKVLTGFVDKGIGETPHPEEESPYIHGLTTPEAKDGVLFKFRQIETLFVSNYGDMESWRGNTGTEDAAPWILKALISEDSAISHQEGPAGGMSFENPSIMVGVKYTFSGFRFQDFRKSIKAFVKNFDVTAPRDINNVSVYLAFPDF